MKLEVYGANHDAATYYCNDLAMKIQEVMKDAVLDDEGNVTRAAEDVEVVFQSFMEIDYMKKLKVIQRESGGGFYHHKKIQLIICDGKYVGGKDEFIKFTKSNGWITEIDEDGNEVVHNRLVREEFTASVAERGNHPMVWMEFADGSKFTDDTTPIYGKIVIELYNDVVPLAANNFMKLSTGELGATEMAKLHYQGCPVHRVVPGGWFQAGDIVLGDGSGSWAAVGQEGKVQDESFVCDFSNPLGGIVGYSTSSAHSIGSQFFVTLGGCDWMNGDYVGVGCVIQGFDTLRRINECKTTNQKPDPSIIVAKSGKLSVNVN
jgi:cyclophilin family peptidyl-prolyl cis-trans isomerase